jgi:hypothetical protein
VAVALETAWFKGNAQYSSFGQANGIEVRTSAHGNKSRKRCGKRRGGSSQRRPFGFRARLGKSGKDFFLESNEPADSRVHTVFQDAILYGWVFR